MLENSDKCSQLQKENRDLREIIQDLEMNLKENEKEMQNYFQHEKELRIVKKDLELTRINNEELQNLLKSSKESLLPLEVLRRH